MPHEINDSAPSNLTEVVDGNNNLLGVFDKKTIRGTSLFYRAIAVLVRSKKTNRILLHKTQQTLFDFTFKTVHEYQKSSEELIESTAVQLLGEKPSQIREIGTQQPENDRNSNFTTFYEIYYSDRFLSQAVRQDIFSLQHESEFISLCHYYPQDIDPLLHKALMGIYHLKSEPN